MIDDRTDGGLAAVQDFARSVGAEDRLQRCLDRLARMARQGRCVLFRDFAAHSFVFVLEDPLPDGSWRTALHGGVLYAGSSQPLDGSAPAFCVRIGASEHPHDWSIHT